MGRPYGNHKLNKEQKKLVEKNINFVKYYFHKKIYPHYFHKGSQFLDDLRSCLYAGLCFAAESYNPEKGAFTTHCVWHFRSKIQEYLKIEKKFHERYKIIPFVKNNINNINTNNSNLDVEDTMIFFCFKGKDSYKYEGDLGDIPDLELKDFSVLLENADLTEKEQLVISLLYQKNLIYAEAGKILGVTGECVRLWKNSALKKMREYALSNNIIMQDILDERLSIK